MSETDTVQQFRRGDTVRWSEVDYDMHVTHVDGTKVTTDAWAEIPANDLSLIEAVEDKYDAINERIGVARKAGRAVSEKTGWRIAATLCGSALVLAVVAFVLRLLGV